MKIALPVTDGQFGAHFGHCEEFYIYETGANNEIAGKTVIKAPPHEPGLLPVFLHEKGVDVVLAGGMGVRAQDLFRERGIKIIVGVAESSPEKIVNDYISGTLVSGQNMCDH